MTEIQHKQIQAVVAVADDWAIGAAGKLLCHLPADLRHFKQVTMGCSLVMGRKTFESLPHKPLPERQNIVITHNIHWHHPAVTVAHSLNQAIEAAQRSRIMIMGGAQVYRAALPLVQVIYLTHIHAHFDHADTYFPTLVPRQWRVTELEHHAADEQHGYPAFDFITLTRTASL